MVPMLFNYLPIPEFPTFAGDPYYPPLGWRVGISARPLPLWFFAFVVCASVSEAQEITDDQFPRLRIRFDSGG